MMRIKWGEKGSNTHNMCTNRFTAIKSRDFILYDDKSESTHSIESTANKILFVLFEKCVGISMQIFSL